MILDKQTLRTEWQPIPVRTYPGFFLALVVLLSAHAGGQILREQLPAVYGQATPSSHAITGRQRIDWFAKSTIGPESLAAGLFSAGFGTARNSPREYGPHWEGFGKRYGMRLTGVSTGNAMEAGLGALWGEDPRYSRAAGGPVKERIRNIVVMTFMARRADGSLAPAYARYAATAGNNLLSNTWRADSESGIGDACLRTALGFAGRMGSNAFAEFWPTVTKHLFHRRQ
jgi:hypothetical protein